MNFCILLSGGVGKRMHLDEPKQYYCVNNRPILIHTLQSVEKCNNINCIVVVAHPNYHDKICRWVSEYKIKKSIYLTQHGDSRQESILHGLEKCIELSENDKDIVVIHDAVRPFISVDLIDKCISALDYYDGVLPVIPVKDTLYYSDNGSSIAGLLERDKIYAGQAPEAFRLYQYYLINKGLSKKELADIKGTTEIAYKNKFHIAVVPGEESNFKITTMEDLDRYREAVNKQ